MDTKQFLDAVVLMLVLFNPLLMSAYLHDVMNTLTSREFFRVMSQAFLISGLAFCGFAWAGDSFFSSVLQVRFSAFLLFGGIIFLIIAVRYIVFGAEMIGQLRGNNEGLAGSIAMPFMIGPGTISASVLAGTKLPVLWACLAIAVALLVSCLCLMVTKVCFDYLQKKNERVLERYLEMTGRASALVIGTIAIEMMMKGVDLWLAERG